MSEYTLVPFTHSFVRGKRAVSYDFGYRRPRPGSCLDGSYWYRFQGEDGVLEEKDVTGADMYLFLLSLPDGVVTDLVVGCEADLEYLLNRLRVGASI